MFQKMDVINKVVQMTDVINQIKDALSKNDNLNGNFANDQYTLGWINLLVDNELMERNLKKENEKIGKQHD